MTITLLCCSPACYSSLFTPLFDKHISDPPQPATMMMGFALDFVLFVVVLVIESTDQSPECFRLLRRLFFVKPTQSPLHLPRTTHRAKVSSKAKQHHQRKSWVFFLFLLRFTAWNKIAFFPHFILFSSYPSASFLSSQDPRFHAHETHTLTCRRLRCTPTLAQIHWNCFIIKKLLPRLPRKSTRRTQKLHFSPPKHNRSEPTPLKIESRQSTAPFVTQFDTKLAVQNVKKWQNIRT